MAKRKITEPALLQKENKKNTFQDRMDRLIGQSPSEERNDLRRQLQDEIFLKVIGNEKQKELESRLEKLSNRDFFRIENKEYLAKRKDYLDKIKFKMEKDALDKRGETIQILNERDKKQDGGLLSDDREKFVFGASALAKMINNLIRKSPKNKDKLIGISPKDLKNLSSADLDAIRKETTDIIREYKTDPSPNARSDQRLEELNFIENFFEDIEVEQYLRKNPTVKRADALEQIRFRNAEQEAEDLGIEAAEIAMEKAERAKKQDGGLLNPEKADLDNDGELSSYEKARGEAIEENMRDKKAIGGGLLGGMMSKVINAVRTNPETRQKLGMPELETDEYGQLKPLPPARISAQVGGMMMDDQMTDMMETEETPDIDNQMADMMPKEKTAEQKAIEKAQAPDEKMEENYVDFLIDEALSDDEEEMLMKELQANPQLSMLFDKVMEVAMEFSGSGPVEGPGSEVSDSIPARLSDGEFVFTAKAVDVLGVDNLMSLMKQAEAQADGRQTAQDGGLMEEEDTVMPVEQQPVRQDIRVTKETVGSQAAMQEEDDLVGDEIKKSMLSNRPYVRS